MRVLKSVVLSLLILLSGCASQQVTPVTDKQGVAFPLPLPVGYSSPLPCSDCQEHTLYLKLQADGLYFLRSETVKNNSADPVVKAEFGLWQYDSVTDRITLTTYDNAQRTLQIMPDKSIKVVAETGGVTKIGLQTELRPSSEKATAVKADVPVQGMYFHEDGQAKVQECLTGSTFTVATGGAYPVLEHKYSTTPRSQDAPLLVSFLGRFTTIGDDLIEEEAALQPVQFVTAYPGVACGGEKINSIQLTGTTWYLTELLGKPVQLAAKQKRPRIFLYEEKRRVKGFGGCNEFSGTYFRMGDVFLFNKRIGKRMACVDGMELEFNFFRVLSATDGFHLEGNNLEFRDRDRNVLARFEQSSNK